MGKCIICQKETHVIHRRFCSDDCLVKYYEIDENGCYIWKSGTCKWGYPQIQRNGKVIKPHRISYEVVYGKINDKKLCVLHKCDVRKCINPDHLFLGTRKDNADDKTRKGRNNSCRGEDSGKAKLTEDEVKKIRKFYEEGLSMRKLAKMFKVKSQSIWAIISKNSWRHL